MVSLQDNIRLGRFEAERLRVFLANLPSRKWATPSACTEWQVADVVGHLTWVGEFYANIHNRALHGSTDPPDNSPGGSANRWGSKTNSSPKQLSTLGIGWETNSLSNLSESMTGYFNSFPG